MTKTKVILTLTVLLVFAAGWVIGRVPHRPPEFPHNGPPGDRNSIMVRELKLTPEQSEQMKKIWSELGPGRPGDSAHWDRRREYQKQRDEAIRALLTPEQQGKYDAIRKEYDDRVAELGKERQAAFQRAVEQTKAILTPEQFQKFESFRNHHREGGPSGPGTGGGPPGGWHGEHRPPGPDHAAATRPE